MKNLNVQEFKNEISDNPKAVIIDVRTPEEKMEGDIENSINLNIMDQAFPAKVMDLAKDQDYYVYCRSGARSASACQFMEKLGLNAFNLEGGIQAWNASN